LSALFHLEEIHFWIFEVSSITGVLVGSKVVMIGYHQMELLQYKRRWFSTLKNGTLS